MRGRNLLEPDAALEQIRKIPGSSNQVRNVIENADRQHSRSQTHLSRLVDRVANGEPFVIAKAGKPLVKVIPFDATPDTGVQRIGFMEGLIEVPDDFDRMGADEIERLCGGTE